MNCPTCKGNGELQDVAEHQDSAASEGDRASVSRVCFGHLENTCHRCNGTGYLEDVE